MEGEIKRLPANEILQRLATLFEIPAHDRHVYCVFGPYSRLAPFQARLREQVQAGSFNRLGTVEYLSINRAIYHQLKQKGQYERAGALADNHHDEQLRRLLSETFRDLITSRIEKPDIVGLVLADFELLYAYDIGNNDISLVRQVAINGKRVCLLVPGAMRDGRLWIFDEDPQARREFPDPLIFRHSGWVFELAD